LSEEKRYTVRRGKKREEGPIQKEKKGGGGAEHIERTKGEKRVREKNSVR